MTMLARLGDPAIRPLIFLVGTIAVLAIADQGTGRFVNVATIFSVMQLFATLGLVALGLGLSMMVREFDISVAGMVSLAGVIGVLTGGENPWLGIAYGVGAGVIGGMIQGGIIVWLRLSSVGVTLGGLLTFGGIAYVLTRNRGPIPLPTRIERYTVLRGPHIDKKSREQFEMRTHKRIIDISEPTARTIEAINRIQVPAGVFVKIKT